MKSKLIILGCGSSMGVPRADGVWGNCDKSNKKNYRTRCSAIVVKGSNSVLIDTSPDIRQQFISNKIKDISSVIFTHEHADQTNGLFELRPFYIKYKKKIDVYATSKTMKQLIKRHDFCFNSYSGYGAIVKPHIINKKFSIGNSKQIINFKPLQVKHGLIMNTVYVFEKTAYINDCNDMSIIKMRDLKNLNNLVIDCLRIEKHPSHFNLNESLYIHKKLKPKKTFLTNLHQDLDYNFLRRRLPKNVFPAYDGLKIDL